MDKTMQLTPEQAAQAQAELQAKSQQSQAQMQDEPPRTQKPEHMGPAPSAVPPQAPASAPAASAVAASVATPEAVEASGDSEALTPAGQLLSDVVDEGIKRGLHEASAFTDRFPPDGIMQELADSPHLRAKILVATLHLPQHTAEMLTPDVAGAALATAVSAGDTSPQAIVDNFAPADRVRQLPWAALWAFVNEGDWAHKNDDAARGFMLLVLERTQALGLMDPSQWRDAITIPKLSDKLPEALVRKLLARATTLGATGKSFTGPEIFAIVTPKDLVDTYETGYLFDQIVVPLARRCHFLVEGGTIPPAKSTQTDLQAASVAPEEPKGPAKASVGGGSKGKRGKKSTG